MSLYYGLFLESSLLPWQRSIISVIRNVLFSIECFFITSIVFSWSMKIDLRESMAIFVRLLRKLLRSTWTAAIRSVDLQEFDVLTVERKDCWPFHAKFADSAHHVIPKDERSGANGCGRSLYWIHLTARSSSLSLRC